MADKIAKTGTEEERHWKMGIISVLLILNEGCFGHL